MIKSNRDKGLKTGVMCISRNREFYDGEVIDLGNSLEEVASNLFDALIEMDKRVLMSYIQKSSQDWSWTSNYE